MRRKLCSLNFSIKLKLLSLILLSGSITGDAQRNSYVIKKKLDITMAAVSLSTIGTCYLLHRQVQPLSFDQINSLKPDNVPSYDRIALGQYDINARKASNILIYATFAARIAVLYSEEAKSEALNIAVVGYQSVFLSQALVYSFKLSKRNRPLLYNSNVPMDVKLERDARFSFFSGHTTTASTLCFTTAYAYKIYYPESKYKNLVWVSAFTIPAVEGYLRVKAGKHYPSDVLTGYLVGLGSSYLMHHLHLKNRRKKAQ